MFRILSSVREDDAPFLLMCTTLVILFGIVSIACGTAYIRQINAQKIVAETSPSPATIISAVPMKRKYRPLYPKWTEAVIRFERRTTTGMVACEAVRLNFNSWSTEYRPGKLFQVYPRKTTCENPIYAPDIHDPARIGWLVLITTTITVLFAGLIAYGLYRTRQREIALAATLAMHFDRQTDDRFQT
ncbi:hypothetical protein [Bradyrhizobium prioriisuperbiae]|uniref:hypothetical protein n=1 Tax=Bradyrhizobium prioriisuperbiae TaxID=2854389 RepID=UPI0028E818BA|nr:hypothetical protein [Bradyrhizobium prioritasuperba]